MGYHKAIAGIGWIGLVPSGTNPTPIELAVVTSMSVDMKEEDVELQGSDLDILDSYPKSRKISGKIEVSEFSSKLVSAVTNGVTVSAGSKVGAVETFTIPATPFTVTVAQGATFDTNLAVVDLTAGKAMTRGATSTGTGVYAVNDTTGVYTFNTADSGHTVLIRYRYTAAASGVTAEIATAAAGAAAPRYSIFMNNGTASIKSGLYIPSARIPGLSVSFKRDGWSTTSLDYTALASSLNKLLYTYSPE